MRDQEYDTMKLMINQLSNLSKSKIFIIFEIVFITGIFLAKYINIEQTNLYFVLFLILLLVIVVVFFRSKSIWILGICGIIFFSGLIYYNYYQQKITPKDIQTDKIIEAQILVYDEPDEREFKTKLKVIIQKVISGDENLTGQKILIDVGKYPQYKYGDLLKIRGKLEQPKIYDDFDYKAYLSRYQIFFIIHNTDVELISKNKGSIIKKFIYSIKDQASENIKKTLSEPASALLNGLLLGLRRGIPQDLIDAFNATGTSHIIAISGLHVAILVRYYQIFTKKWPKNLVFILGILGLAFYSIITGLRTSVIRASCLAGSFLLARQLGRKGSIVNILIFIAFLMVLQNPLILHNDIGFQLSFLAVLGIVYLSPIFNQIFAKCIKFTPRILREILSATLAAQLATLPIILANFGRISILSPLTNLLILLVVPIVIPSGFLMLGLSFINLTLAKIVGYFVWLLLKYIIIIVELFATIKISLFKIDFNSWQFILIYYLLMIIILVYLYKKYKLMQKYIYK